MPTCKNDCRRYYRGDEPSPKGLGYCAHAEKINKRRRGKDGKFWVVKAVTMKGNKRIRRWARVKKVVTKKCKATGGKSYLKGGVGGMMGLGFGSIGTHVARQESDKKRIAELKRRLAQCNSDENEIRRKLDGKSKETKEVALAPLQKKCNKIHDELRRLGVLR